MSGDTVKGKDTAREGIRLRCEGDREWPTPIGGDLVPINGEEGRCGAGFCVCDRTLPTGQCPGLVVMGGFGCRFPARTRIPSLNPDSGGRYLTVGAPNQTGVFRVRHNGTDAGPLPLHCQSLSLAVEVSLAQRDLEPENSEHNTPLPSLIWLGPTETSERNRAAGVARAFMRSPALRRGENRSARLPRPATSWMLSHALCVLMHRETTVAAARNQLDSSYRRQKWVFQRASFQHGNRGRLRHVGSLGCASSHFHLSRLA